MEPTEQELYDLFKAQEEIVLVQAKLYKLQLAAARMLRAEYYDDIKAARENLHFVLSKTA